MNPDVIVIGGGPAGSTASTLIAQPGRKVVLFERERFPRFHIGESLIPETYWVLKRLNMLPKMQASHFTRKYSVQFVSASGRQSAPFLFPPPWPFLFDGRVYNLGPVTQGKCVARNP